MARCHGTVTSIKLGSQAGARMHLLIVFLKCHTSYFIHNSKQSSLGHVGTLRDVLVGWIFNTRQAGSNTTYIHK